VGAAIAFGQFQRDADVPVHQAQAIVVTGHQDRTALVPLLVAFDQADFAQGRGDALVQPFNPPGPFAHGTEQLERIKGLQQLLRPIGPGRVIARRIQRWTCRLQQVQVVAITLGAVALPVQHQALKAVVMLALEA